MSNIGRITSNLRTDTGLVRDHNEDFVDFWEPTTPDEEANNGWLYLVADGVGGADAGEVASQYASERTIAHYLDTSDQPDWGRRILDAMQAANTDLRQMVLEKNNNSRMATTMVTAVIQNNHLFVGNVGDSRGYLWRQGTLQQVTKDQSLVAKLLEEGAITAEEARNHPRKNVILYSLGSENQPKIDLFELTWETGDILVLCSDGLTKHVDDAEISQIITAEPPEQATRILISLANERGGEDNISVAIVRYETDEKKKKQRKRSETAVSASVPTQYRTLLWLYTIFLSVLQSILIFLVWFFLRV
ncbi:MAG: Stp1/IreP family PP2C-type Ser/Thr phosphatase [Anaerolineales bacterium]|nr:Stp1/IreP family PP2C-type Ser/Thr phosphatase [Anaerolineales bacterium]MCA9927419.1 Stp1/IreP family PP2C-type Ser/Thr phosphatase [Anaerolineales bacterium]